MKATHHEYQDSYDFSFCPYNSTHRFEPHKYFHHIKRCKDGLKVRHQYQECQYNALHVFKKQQISGHQLECPDRRLSLKKKQAMIKAYHQHQTALKSDQDSSSVKAEQQQPIELAKDDATSLKILQNCQECQLKLKALEPILITISRKNRNRLKQLMDKYGALCRKQTRGRRSNSSAGRSRGRSTN